MNNYITYTKNASLAKSIFGVALFLSGIILIGFGYLIAGLFWGGIALSVLTKPGAQLDLSAKRYRRIKSVAGMHFGKWAPFPEFEYVTVFKTKEKKSVTIVTASATSSGSIILLNLFYTGNKHFTIYSTTNKDEAFKVARRLQVALTIDILDATGDEKKWIEPEVA